MSIPFHVVGYTLPLEMGALNKSKAAVALQLPCDVTPTPRIVFDIHPSFRSACASDVRILQTWAPGQLPRTLAGLVGLRRSEDQTRLSGEPSFLMIKKLIYF